MLLFRSYSFISYIFKKYFREILIKYISNIVCDLYIQKILIIDY